MRAPTTTTTTTALVAAALSLPLLATATLPCYYMDGSSGGGTSFVPCDAGAAVSACCLSNKTSGVQDACLSSGLCLALDSGFVGFVYANGCTDKTGQSARCPHVCPNQSNDWEGGSAVQSWNVLQCQPGVYCCRESTNYTSCCTNASALVTTDLGTMLLASATSTSTSTSTSASSSATTTQSSSSSSSSSAAVVGGAVGGALGAAVLGALGALAFTRARARRRPRGEGGGGLGSDPAAIMMAGGQTTHGGESARYYVLGDQSQTSVAGNGTTGTETMGMPHAQKHMHELQTDRSVRELPG